MPKSRERELICAILATVAATDTLSAQPGDAHPWRELAKRDADAELTLIADNHPGAAAELGDTDFLARLTIARERASGKVDTFQGL